MLRILARIFLVVFVLFLVLVLFPAFLPILSGGTRGRHVREQKHYAELFKASDTNAPLLAMDWFSEHSVYYCRVSQSGDAFSARDVGYARQGGNRISLDSTNKLLLIQAINQLPLQSKHFLPKERQILISGIRSNQWFQCVYDRVNVPPEVEKLYDLTGAYLEWYIPKVGSHPEGVKHSMSQHDSAAFAIAKDAPYAVSISGGFGLQIWNLNGWRPSKAAKLVKIPSSWGEYAIYGWNIATISPNGQTVIFETHDALFAVDRQNQKLLWRTSPLAWGNLYHASGRTLAVGNQGQSFFIAEANSIERWNLANGTKLGTLATNDTGIKFLQISWNGGVLVVGFGDNSFTVWNTDKDEPVYHFTEPAGANCMAISPDGQKIVLNASDQRKFVVYDWQHGERKEFPLRTPYASFSAYSMCWSPDGRRLAADINTYPSSLIVYDAISWKPIAEWPCGAIGSGSLFAFNKEGRLFQLMDGEVNSLDVTALKSLGD
jgi:hypothetical protein